MRNKLLLFLFLNLITVRMTYAGQFEANWVAKNRIPGYSRCWVASIQMYQIVEASRPDTKKLNDNLNKIKQYLISNGIKNEAMITAELDMEIARANSMMSKNPGQAGDDLIKDFLKCVKSFEKK